MWSLIFPGQGSQSVGMGKPLFDEFTKYRHVFEEASDTLSYDMKKLCFEDPNSQLGLTEFTQPSLLTASFALSKVLDSEIDMASCELRAGHSLGEYSALVSTGAIPFASSLRAVQKRGQEMQSAVPKDLGGMVACLGVTEDLVLDILNWVKENFKEGILEAANFNSPEQIVLSGHKNAIHFLIENYTPEVLKHEKKAKFIPLNVSAPFHCSLMTPAQENMSPILEALEFKTSNFKVVQNVTANVTKDLNEQKSNLLTQITSPVKWTQTIEHMKSNGISHFIEVGPGKVLAGLNKKIDREGLKTFNIATPNDILDLQKTMKEVIQ